MPFEYDEACGISKLTDEQRFRIERSPNYGRDVIEDGLRDIAHTGAEALLEEMVLEDGLTDIEARAALECIVNRSAGRCAVQNASGITSAIDFRQSQKQLA